MGRISITVKPTNDCNMRCKHCYHAEEGFDNTMMLPEAAKKMFSIASKDYDEIHVVFLNTPLSQCAENNKKRSGLKNVPMDAIYRMYTTMKIPTWSEGIKYLHIITNYEEEEIIDLEEEALKKWSL